MQQTSVTPHPTLRPRSELEQRLAPLLLVVDDSATIRILLIKMLSPWGYHVQTFPDGLALLRWLSAHRGALPVCILLDIELPMLDGFALTRLLRAKSALARTTILLMSSHESEDHRTQGQEAGAQGSLLKPFTAEEMRRTLARCQQQSRAAP